MLLDKRHCSARAKSSVNVIQCMLCARGCFSKLSRPESWSSGPIALATHSNANVAKSMSLNMKMVFHSYRSLSVQSQESSTKFPPPADFHGGSVVLTVTSRTLALVAQFSSGVFCSCVSCAATGHYEPQWLLSAATRRCPQQSKRVGKVEKDDKPSVQEKNVGETKSQVQPSGGIFRDQH